MVEGLIPCEILVTYVYLLAMQIYHQLLVMLLLVLFRLLQRFFVGVSMSQF